MNEFKNIFLIVVLVACFCFSHLAASAKERASVLPTPGTSPSKLTVIRTIPHTGYSEGLDFHEGFLWHATKSEILKIDPADGSILQRVKPPTEWSESLAWLGGKLFNLSFSENGIWIGTPKKDEITFARAGDTPEDRGWGMTHNGKQLIVTGTYGSKKLYFLNPKTVKVEKTVTTTVSDLEDLAWDGKYIWSSSFVSHEGEIFPIHPTTGEIKGFYALPNPELCPVIDGLAYDGKDLWVTGKNCPVIFYVKKPI